MLDLDQAVAYAEADFSESDNRFVQRFIELFGVPAGGEIVDLGCGPGNIAQRVAQTMPDCRVTGVDGSAAMLEIARARADQSGLSGLRLRYIEDTLPSTSLGGKAAVGIVSNSLLHHLHEPAVLWDSLRQIAAPGAAVLIGDLRRPADEQTARQIVDTYAADEAEILREDFFNSLLAAFEIDEVRQQLAAAGLDGLQVQAIGDRHLEVFGRMPA